jgi:2-polyprenyl-3-methyl-5-hydroxy-6-metoxy-1,4-benzoquinol methylase
MPSLGQNLDVWNDQYLWPQEGDEWSAQFGGTEAMWWFAVYPRIHRFLPAPTILEIAPGKGRWTQFLKAQCQSMIAVDISEKCIEHCRARFASDRHVKFHVNDGGSLAAVPDGSIDFVFSFDSLVHAEKEVIEGYLVQLERKLTANGVGLIHHSNIGAYPGRLAIMQYYRRLPIALRAHVLTEANMEAILSINIAGWRATSMTAALFRPYCEKAGLKCISQELINWVKGRCLVDSISVFTRPGSRWDTKNSYLRNGEFIGAAGLTNRLARLYCR